MSTDLTRDTATASEIALAPDIDALSLLDPYAGGLALDAPAMTAIATISAGEKVPGRDGKEIPSAVKDGRIILHDPEGRAPGLAEILKANGGKRLTVAFPSDNPATFFQQRFLRYNSAALEVYGDARSITRIQPSEDRKSATHTTYQEGSDEYARLAKTCKAYTSVYFVLARWTESGEHFTYYPDGLGPYRLRTTSRHSAREIRNAILTVQRLCGGQVAGVPLDLALDYREVADPTGAKRRIPVWTLVLRPPRTIVLDVPRVRQIALEARAEMGMLALPAPEQETLQTTLSDPDVSPAEERLVGRLTGERCDAAYWASRWHATVAGTELDDDNARAMFLFSYTDGATSSLADFLAHATDAEASALLATLQANMAPRGGAAQDDPPPAVAPERASQGWDAFVAEQEAQAADADAPPDAELEEDAEPEPDADPLLAEARSALRFLQTTAQHIANQDGGEQPALASKIRYIVSLVRGELRASDEDQGILLRAAFGLDSWRALTHAQERALHAWTADLPRARSQMAAIVAVHGRERLPI